MTKMLLDPGYFIDIERLEEAFKDNGLESYVKYLRAAYDIGYAEGYNKGYDSGFADGS